MVVKSTSNWHCITSSTEMRLNKVCCHLTFVDGKSRPRT